MARLLPAVAATVCVAIVVFAATGCERSPRPGYNYSHDRDAGTDDIGVESDASDTGDADARAECDPVEVCEDYCREKHVRCVADQCEDLMTNYAANERQFCIEGIVTEDEDGEPETFLEGCVDRASESPEACNEFRQDAEVYAEQPCSSDEQQYRLCNELRLFLTGQGDTIHRSCGCTPGGAGESCDEDSDCDEWDDGVCIDDQLYDDDGMISPGGDDEEVDASICTAECHDFDGNMPIPIVPDPSCADQNGVCLDMHALNVTDSELPDTTCQRYCTGIEDCPGDSSCAPVFPLQDDEALGLCTRGLQWDLDVILCEPDSDDCPAGHGCVDGTCQPFCDGDGTICNFGDCGADDYCNIDFVDFF